MNNSLSLICYECYEVFILNQKLDQIFNNLMKINHPNIVKFHGFWNDERNLRVSLIQKNFIAHHSYRLILIDNFHNRIYGQWLIKTIFTQSKENKSTN